MKGPELYALLDARAREIDLPADWLNWLKNGGFLRLKAGDVMIYRKPQGSETTVSISFAPDWFRLKDAMELITPKAGRV